MMSPARSERAPLRPLLTHSELTHLEGPLHPRIPHRLRRSPAVPHPPRALDSRWRPRDPQGRPDPDGASGTKTWAAIMQRVFGLDELVSPRCARCLRLIATISGRRVAERLVAHTGNYPAGSHRAQATRGAKYERRGVRQELATPTIHTLKVTPDAAASLAPT